MTFMTHRQAGYLEALSDLRKWVRAQEFDSPEKTNGAFMVANKAGELGREILAEADRLAAIDFSKGPLALKASFSVKPSEMPQ